jgi:para-nitrobenzyl esterase
LSGLFCTDIQIVALIALCASPFVFQHLGELKPPAAAADQMILDAMATYWTNFAKRGDPNGSGAPTGRRSATPVLL